MITQIGIAAGNILEFLEENESAELSKLLLTIDGSHDLILMSLGWLIREGYVVLGKDNRDSMLYSKVAKKQISKKGQCPYLQRGTKNVCTAYKDVLMIPSVSELESCCLNGNYDNCIWKQEKKRNSQE